MFTGENISTLHAHYALLGEKFKCRTTIGLSSLCQTFLPAYTSQTRQDKAFISLPKVALINYTARNPTEKMETFSKCKTRSVFRFTVHF